MIIGTIPPYLFHSSMKQHYDYQYVKSLERIQKTEGEQRLIFVWGSNLAFGIDSKLIEDSLSLKVVSFGIHAGIGLKKYLFDLKKHLTSNDIVVLIPEFEIYDLNFYEKELYTVEYLQTKTLLSSFKLSIKDYLYSVKTNYPRMLKYTLRGYFNNKMISSGYNVNQFNDYGEYIIVNEEKKKNIEFNYEIDLSESILNTLQNYMLGVKFFISPPPHQGETIDDLTIFEYNNLMNEFFQLRYLCCLEDFSLDERYFLDSQYHLTVEGKKIRTQGLIKSLKQKIEIN